MAKQEMPGAPGDRDMLILRLRLPPDPAKIDVLLDRTLRGFLEFAAQHYGAPVSAPTVVRPLVRLARDELARTGWTFKMEWVRVISLGGPDPLEPWPPPPEVE